MHYLECIALLKYLLNLLYEGQRTQVPLSVTEEVASNLLNIKTLMGKDLSTDCEAAINDCMSASTQLMHMTGMQVLSANMKNILVEGVSTVVSTLSLEAFEYYKTHDFEDNDQTRPIVMDIVKCALEEGVI